MSRNSGTEANTLESDYEIVYEALAEIRRLEWVHRRCTLSPRNEEGRLLGFVAETQGRILPPGRHMRAAAEPAPSCYCDAPETQATCPVHGKAEPEAKVCATCGYPRSKFCPTCSVRP